jgi:hypothetical protein
LLTTFRFRYVTEDFEVGDVVLSRDGEPLALPEVPLAESASLLASLAVRSGRQGSAIATGFLDTYDSNKPREQVRAGCCSERGSDVVGP